MGEAQASGPTENKPQILYPGDGGRGQDAPDCGDLSEDEPTLQSLDWQDQGSLGKGQLDKGRSPFYESQTLERVFWHIEGSTNALEKASCAACERVLEKT